MLDRRALGQETRCTRPDGLDRRGGIRVAGQYHDRGRGRHRGQPPGEIYPVRAANADIHEHRVGRTGRHGREHLIGVADGYGLEVRFRGEDRLQTLAEDPVVIDDDQVRAH